MTDRSKPRKPATFRLDDANVVVVDTDEAGRPARGTVQIMPEAELQLPVPIETPCPAAARLWLGHAVLGRGRRPRAARGWRSVPSI